MYTVEPVPRVVYIGFAHSQVSSTLHADAIRISQESAGSLQDLKRRTRAGKHACIHKEKNGEKGKEKKKCYVLEI